MSRRGGAAFGEGINGTGESSCRELLRRGRISINGPRESDPTRVLHLRNFYGWSNDFRK